MPRLFRMLTPARIAYLYCYETSFQAWAAALHAAAEPFRISAYILDGRCEGDPALGDGMTWTADVTPGEAA